MTNRMNPIHRKVLAALAESYSRYEDFCFSGFSGLCTRTGLDRKEVRRSCRYLARKGLAVFGRGLWTEDGEMAGSGYAATRAGADLMAEIEKEETLAKHKAETNQFGCVGT